MSVRLLSVPLLVGLALGLGACGGSSSSATSSSTTSPATTTASTSATSGVQATASIGPEGIPLQQGPELAPASTTTPGTPVHGIECAPIEQLAYHIHAHLQVYVAGSPRTLPAAIGLLGPTSEQTPYGLFYGASRCYYWLHTHATDGVIHIESPTPAIYTLGEFFDEWRQPLSPVQVGPATGKVTAYVDGKLWSKSPRAIPLVKHTVIQLDVGSPTVPFHPVSWAGTQL